LQGLKGLIKNRNTVTTIEVKSDRTLDNFSQRINFFLRNRSGNGFALFIDGAVVVDDDRD
jgi:hypothetical protein